MSGNSYGVDGEEEIVDSSPRRLASPDVDDHLEAALEGASSPRIRAWIRQAMQLRIAERERGRDE
jgi:hypothetical protein